MMFNEVHLGKTLSIGLISSAALLMTACGGSSSNDSRSTTPDPTPTPTPTPQPTPEPTPEPTEAKVSGPLDPVQDEVVTGVVSAQVASQLPEPLNVTVACGANAVNHLIDVPDALLLATEGAAAGADPFDAFNSAQADMQGAFERFAAQFQATLATLVERGSCDPSDPGEGETNNPLAGTPLEPVGAELATLIATLQETDGDPNLTSVTSTIAPVLTQLSASFATVPAEVRGAPVVGGVLSTVETALNDVATLLPAVGNYNAAATENAIEVLLSNALSNVLLGVLPVADIDAATGENFSAEIQSAINTLTAQLGDGLGQLITPIFNQGLNGALSPVLDPVEGLIANLLNEISQAKALGDNPLKGILVVEAGDGNLLASSTDSLLAMLIAGATGVSLDQLVEGVGLTSGTVIVNISVLNADASAVQIDVVLGEMRLLSEGLGLSLQDIVDDVFGPVLSGGSSV